MSTHVVEKLLFSIVLSILTFDFDLIFGSFLTFWSDQGQFLGSGTVQELFWGPLIYTKNFCFQSVALFLLYLVVML